MTQQPEANQRGDDAAGEVATHVAGKYRQGLPGRRDADPGRAIGRDLVQHQSHSLQPKRATPIGMWTDLARLEFAFPGFSFAIWEGWDGPRLEAWRDTVLDGLYAIITDDPCELWRELEMVPR